MEPTSRTTKPFQDPLAYADGFQRWQILLTLWVCGLIELYFADETGLTMQPYVPYGRFGGPMAAERSPAWLTGSHRHQTH